MSFVAKCEVEVKDLKALAKACEKLGLQFNTGKTNFKQHLSHGRGAECLHTISVKGNPNAYEVGVIARTDGKPGYQFILDTYGGGQGLVEKIGRNCETLMQRYGVEVGKKAAILKGFRVTEHKLPNGAIKLVAQR